MSSTNLKMYTVFGEWKNFHNAFCVNATYTKMKRGYAAVPVDAVFSNFNIHKITDECIILYYIIYETTGPNG